MTIYTHWAWTYVPWLLRAVAFVQYHCYYNIRYRGL